MDGRDDYVYGKVVAALSGGFSPGEETEPALGSLLRGIDYERAEVLFHAKAGASGGIGDIILIHLADKSAASALRAAEALSARPHILYAEPDYREAYHAASNDPLYRQLWGLQRIGASQAWNCTTGSPLVTRCV